MLKKFVFWSVVILLSSCGGEEPSDVTDDFDRGKMLSNWADNIIIPAYVNYQTKLSGLKTQGAIFTNEPTGQNLENLRTSWINAYKAWQHVSMFEVGKAESLNMRNYTNIYPTDPSGINDNIASGGYNLELPSKNDEQGFPALDYMINGLASTDIEIVAIYTNQDNGQAHKTYLTDLVARIAAMTDEVVTDWKGSYRDTFVSDDGSSATNATNKVVNDFLFYYEKFLRAGKVGIPAGVFSGSAIPTAVEAYYHGEVSKALFQEALASVENFFNGQHFGASTQGESLKSYLDYLNTIKDGEDLSGLINTQFSSSRSAASLLDDNFSEQIGTDNSLMLQTYDELQKNVILMKVDMMQALNVKIDYIDADGD